MLIWKWVNNIKIIEVKERTEKLINQLLEVWEDSVKATHTFLSNEEIDKRICTTGLKKYNKLNNYRKWKTSAYCFYGHRK